MEVWYMEFRQPMITRPAFPKRNFLWEWLIMVTSVWYSIRVAVVVINGPSTFLPGRSILLHMYLLSWYCALVCCVGEDMYLSLFTRRPAIISVLLRTTPAIRVVVDPVYLVGTMRHLTSSLWETYHQSSAVVDHVYLPLAHRHNNNS